MTCITWQAVILYLLDVIACADPDAAQQTAVDICAVAGDDPGAVTHEIRAAQVAVTAR